MAEESNIEWTDATFNPWVGCTKISPACDNCYAADWAQRFGDVEWGDHPRRRTSEKNWNLPRRWNRMADEWEATKGRPRFVFCASLADVFDNQVDPSWRNDLWALIKECDRLVWLLLTKRPQNIAKMLPADWGDGYPNVWLGTTVENQEVADRNIPHLVNVPVAKRFLSIEPIVGPVDLRLRYDGVPLNPFYQPLGPCGYYCSEEHGHVDHGPGRCAIHWVITGGESGPNARPAHPDWYRSLRDQCQDAGVPFHFKQWGEWVPCWMEDNYDGNGLAPIVDDAATDDPGDEKWYDFKAKVTTAFKMDHWRVGKKRAGRLLDGRTWDERPEAKLAETC